MDSHIKTYNYLKGLKKKSKVHLMLKQKMEYVLK